MSPTARKSKRGWGSRGRSYRAQPHINFKPRPHIQVQVNNLRIEALIDPGSETSLLSGGTVHALQLEGFAVQSGGGQVHLAEGTTADTPGTMTSVTSVAN